MGRTLRLLAVVVILVVAQTAPSLAQAADPTAAVTVTGTPHQMSGLATRTLAEINAGRRPGPEFPAPRAPLRIQEGRAALPLDPGSAALRATPQPSRAQPAAPRLPQATGTQFLGTQANESFAVPPDSMGTVGPTQYVVMVNGRIRSFTKATGVVDGVLDSTTDSFWTTLFGFSVTGTSDPRVRYDRLSGRWFFSMITAEVPTNHILIAYSDTSALTGTTQIHARFIDVNIPRPSCLWDYDTLGVDAKALYIGGNIFCTNGTVFSGSDGLVIPKAGLLAGSPVYTHFLLAGKPTNTYCNVNDQDGPYTPQGVDNYSAGAVQGYFIGTSVCTYGRLNITRISNPGTSPSATTLRLTVPQTAFPLSVPALGSSTNLDAGDDRLFAAHLRGGHLWTAHNLCVDSTGAATPTGSPPYCSGDRDAARWYDITNLGSTPALNQSGTVFDPTASNPRNYWIPSMMVSGQGHVAMGSSAAGTLEHAEAATMGRLAGDSIGSTQTPVIYQTSAFTYNINDSASPHRWGDYSYTSLDPTDDMTMWTIQEFTNATDSWGVEVVKLVAPPPATPTSAGNGPFYADRTSQTMTVTGSSIAGSGFFDPGAGFTGRLQATISGSVTVNSVTYVDPTHMNVNFSTAGVATGLKDLTVTNPDGQAITATNFLNIQAPPALASAITVLQNAQQYVLGSANNGSVWVELDPANLEIVRSPLATRPTLVTANADLWTSSAGYNQDLGIFYSDPAVSGGTDQLLAWKESGGFAGTFSPNAAFVQVLFDMTSGHTYIFKLKWKPNKPAPAGTIHAGAGPLTGGAFSPTSMTSEVFPLGAAPNFVPLTTQPQLSNSDGGNWQPLGGVATTLNPGADSTAVLGGSADLWTDTAGYNQDLGIFVSVNSTSDNLVAWKESGGFAGTFSPNAAFVKATYPMLGGSQLPVQAQVEDQPERPRRHHPRRGGADRGPVLTHQPVH